MHPIFFSRRALVFHCLTWVLAGLTVALLIRTVVGLPWTASLLFGIPMGCFGGPMSLSAWFVSQSSSDDAGAFRAAMTSLVASVLAGIAWALAGQAWWTALGWLGASMGDAQRPGLYPLLLGLGALGYLLAIAGYRVVHSFDETAKAGRRALESEVAHREAELRALRAQIDPHFLFNSLNSIAGLISGAPDQAREMCQRLGDFLRDSLRVGSGPHLPLSREVALVEQYLRIEQVRFGARLQIRISVAPDTAEALVPPLLLQPLVENAVRHGVATLIEGGEVAIEARRAGERVVITVTNPRDPDAKRGGTRLGLDIVRRRLAGSFGERASLTIEPSPDAYKTSVTLPFEESV